MNEVFIIVMLLLAAFIIFSFAKMAKINNRIDYIYNKSFTMQGEIEANTARSQNNYKLIAQVNTKLVNLRKSLINSRRHEPTDEPAKEVEKELENLVVEKDQTEEDIEELYRGNLASDELSIRRERFAHFRKCGMDIKNAGAAVGVSYSTAKRYEQWRKDNKK